MSQFKFLGIGKNTHNSNATLLKIDESGRYSWKTYINERLDRKKWSGQWPLQSLLALQRSDDLTNAVVSENRDITSPQFQEGLLNKVAPFYEMLAAKNLQQCTRHHNKNILTFTHHPAHAYALLATLPYKKAYLLIRDGGGSKREDYELDSFHDASEGDPNEIEHTSFYFWDGKKLHLLDQQWLKYENSKIEGIRFSEGVGSFYEKAAELIFKDGQSSGKVMGLAGFGEKSLGCSRSYSLWQESWPWQQRFQGGGKETWQRDENLSVWQNLASEVQAQFEYDLFDYLEQQLEKYGAKYGEHPLAMSGGCALNCTANFKLYKRGLFPDIYISPFPGDESISLGTAFGSALLQKKLIWQPRSWEEQRSNFCPITDNRDDYIKNFASNFQVEEIDDETLLCSKVAAILQGGNVVAWFQGPSECGPRALGHRSLLVRADAKEIKRYLNDKIKFREDFRPYGASVLAEDAHLYFDVPQGFQNPFMSFTTPIRSEYRELLKEIKHVDGTCRMQTVMKGQNSRYYELLSACKQLYGLGILLNTSLNIMGQPIVEGHKDALDFFEKSDVSVIVIGRYIINK